MISFVTTVYYLIYLGKLFTKKKYSSNGLKMYRLKFVETMVQGNDRWQTQQKGLFWYRLWQTYQYLWENSYMKLSKVKYNDTWQFVMLKKDFEIIFNCVDEFHLNPAVKNKNVIRQCFNRVLLSQSRVNLT